ncbi:MAG: DNA repair exonuclease [Candidatus Aenigmatarchaeota archaeon]
MLRFAHISDCHLGCWHNHPELAAMPLRAFERAINACINQKMDFILIAGDLFDTNLPSIDIVSAAAAILKKANDAGILVYVVPGSHDFSPSGKTMISVFEAAGLLKNVAAFEEDETGITLQIAENEKAVICGMAGRAGGLEVELFKKIRRSQFTPEQKNKFRIFMFHSALEEYKPAFLKELSAMPISLLPKGFDYYATGHVHHTFEMKEDGLGAVVFPGALFPCDFTELERQDNGGFYIVSVDDAKNIKLDWQEIKLANIAAFKISANEKSAEEVQRDISEKLSGKNFENTIVLLRIAGTLSSGKPSDINFEVIAEKTNALVVKRNVSALKTKEFEEISKETEETDIEKLEDKIINEHLNQIKLWGNEKKTILSLMDVMKEEKGEETTATYMQRIIENARRTLGLI